MTRAKQLIRRVWQDFYLVFIMAFLYAPIVTMMVLSFNASKSRTQWGGFTLSWYTQMFASRNIINALHNTLLIAFLSALIALASWLMWFCLFVFLERSLCTTG